MRLVLVTGSGCIAGFSCAPGRLAPDAGLVAGVCAPGCLGTDAGLVAGFFCAPGCLAPDAILVAGFFCGLHLAPFMVLKTTKCALAAFLD